MINRKVHILSFISHNDLYKYINSSQLHTGIFLVQRSGPAGRSEVEPVLGAGDGGGADRLLPHQQVVPGLQELDI